MNEEWRDVVGYEGLYQVSNYGNIKSCDRYVNSRYGCKRFSKGIMLKKVLNSDGYHVVALCKDGKHREGKVHRLVAEAFIPNPENKPCIDHINTNRTDNVVENLRWVTPKENSNNKITLQSIRGENAYWFGKHQKEEAKEKISKRNSKRIYQCDLDGNVIRIYKSAVDASNELKCVPTAIRNCLRGRCKSCKGFTWKYVYND